MLAPNPPPGPALKAGGGRATARTIVLVVINPSISRRVRGRGLAAGTTVALRSAHDEPHAQDPARTADAHDGDRRSVGNSARSTTQAAMLSAIRRPTAAARSRTTMREAS